MTAVSSIETIDPSHLETCGLLSSLCAKERAALTTRLEHVEAKPGKFIIREGSDGNDLYFIAQGKVKVCKTDNESKEVILAICGRGDVIGEIALLTNSKRTADVVSLSKCILWRLTQEDFLAHARTFSGLSLALLRFMAIRVRASSARIADLALYDVTSRLGRVLFEISSSVRVDGEDLQVVNDPPTHQALASMIGSSREAVTRALHLLEQDRHIAVDDGRIWLYSLPA